ncbi:protocatechuate 3,4-dioxygenase, beta subunit [Jannaschia faecimaris]|uniref:Protocatechuate 3,4-dioxygenase, beta subunit n=1 Tax=Jannaschia faecimaris TaxID=1244108 RepID=A0A1H3TH97_9RHOB|nr:protocatechuate 3,4-dioxygenase subunit beta [Jannaschia faecimaris]SDZ49682.1 protocatechuate 3,4-dioxygenase, beta subunit [Jannaschia faecimaris]
MTGPFTGNLAPRAAGLHPPALSPAYRSTRLRSPAQAPIGFPSTATEEAGPTFGHDLIGALDADLTRNFGPGGAIGEQILVLGHLRDEECRPVPAALIEVWQANAGGRYRHKNDGYLAPLDPGFGGCGRCMTDAQGAFMFRTVRPGAYPWPNGGNDWRPAHIHFSVFGRAFGQRLITQMYFEGDPHIALCPIVQSIPDKSAIDRLTARLDMGATVPFDARAYRFDITLRGLNATPFEGPP